MTTFHIRRRLPRLGGRPFYRDRGLAQSRPSDRYTGTYCGSGPTTFDVAHHDRPTAWKRNSDGEQFRPCADCLERKIEATPVSASSHIIQSAHAQAWLTDERKRLDALGVEYDV